MPRFCPPVSAPNQRPDDIHGNVLVVLALGGLGAGRENRFGEPLGDLHAGRQRNSAHLSRDLVVLPSGSDQVAAHDGLHRQRPGAPDHHRPAAHGGAILRVVEHAFGIDARQVVGDDAPQPGEPEIRHGGQYGALAGDRVRKDHVEGRQPVGGDDQQVPVVHAVDVPDLAAMQPLEAREAGFEQRFGECFGHGIGACLRDGIAPGFSGSVQRRDNGPRDGHSATLGNNITRGGVRLRCRARSGKFAGDTVRGGVPGQGAPMIWVGKAVGGVLGLMVGSYVGLAVGVLVGHQFDRGLAKRSADGQPAGFTSEHIQSSFFRATFAVMGHIAKADGRVSETEIRAARLVMHGMKLSPAQVESAVEHFHRGQESRLSAGCDPGAAALAVAGSAGPDPGLRGNPGSSCGRGGPDRPDQAGSPCGGWPGGLGLGRVELAQIEALVRAHQARGAGRELVSLEDAYEVLGVEPGASDQEVKTAYRRLMNQHHPDKLVSRGLPESMMGVAEQKTQEIRAAYERIKSQRDFR